MSEDPKPDETPPTSRRRWRPVAALGALAVLPVLAAVMVGVVGGVGAFTFGYAGGSAYLSNNPEACASCHVMGGHYDGWIGSGHSHVAVCNDCHLPSDFVGKWVTKLDNGFFHSLAFTTGDFAEPIRIKARNRRVTQRACLGCHRDFVNHMLPSQEQDDGETLLCVSCHSGVGHRGRR